MLHAVLTLTDLLTGLRWTNSRNTTASKRNWHKVVISAFIYIFAQLPNLSDSGTGAMRMQQNSIARMQILSDNFVINKREKIINKIKMYPTRTAMKCTPNECDMPITVRVPVIIIKYYLLLFGVQEKVRPEQDSRWSKRCLLCRDRQK